MMEEILFHNSTVVSLSLGVCAVLAAIGAMILARTMLRTSTASVRRFLELRFRPTALRYTEEFEWIFDAYQEKVRLLGTYTPHHTNVFNEANWAKLIITLDQVGNAYKELCDLLDQGESRDALCLAEFLIAAGEELPAWKYRRIDDRWERLATWEPDVHAIIGDVVKNLWSEVQQSRGLGISRGVSVEETKKILEEVRKSL
jgi:hypothetical protein